MINEERPYQLHCGDCLEVLRTMPDNSVDAVVTDPPYGLSFMGKRWDYDVPSEEIWSECLRVLKPGGHLLAFAGTRTQHRMAVRIEDAGFEIRDMIAWVYGSGFPKSLDVSKAIDKAGGNRAGFAEFRDAVKDAMKRNNLSRNSLESALGNYMLSHYLTAGSQPAVPNYRDYVIIRDHVGLGDTFDNLFAPEAEREVVGRSENGIAGGSGKHAGQEAAYGFAGEFNITAPATDAAKQWHGWGTALKPALEPITVARKPLIGTVAENVLTWGTGGMNVDGCRVEGEPPSVPQPRLGVRERITYGFGTGEGRNGTMSHASGRWPANLIHDGSEEVVGLFPETGGGSYSKSGGRNLDGPSRAFGSFDQSVKNAPDNYGDSGSAARFFYCAKASKRDRDEGCEGMEERNVNRYGEQGQGPLPQQTPRVTQRNRNHHPTVKPTDLMRYLCRLVTPPNGIVLDPFMGSGSTGKAAILEGFRFVGIEREEEYIQIATARIEWAVENIDKQQRLL